jgi:PST family polysaccharide transporter
VTEHEREPLSDPRVLPERLRQATLTGVRWSSATRLLAEVASFLGSVVLAHLVGPADFGVAIVAIGLAAVAPAMIGAGFGVPLVQMRNVDRGHLQAAGLLSVASGVGLTLATVFLVVPLAIEPVFGSRVAYLLALVSPAFALAGVGTVPNAQLQRELRFRRLSEIEIVSIITSPVVSISLAATTDLAAEAVVLGVLGLAAVARAATVASAPRAGLRWHGPAAREVLASGAFASATALTAALSRNVHYAILGARLPAQDVGLFWRAYQLAVDYQTKVGTITVRIAFPVFSRSADVEQMRHLRARILQVQSIVIFPLLATLVVLAPEIVPVVYGPEWAGAAFPAQVLAVAGMATVAGSVGVPLAFAAGKGRQLLAFSVVQVAGLAAVVAATSDSGLRAVSVAVAVYQVAITGVQFAYLESRHVGVPFRETWNVLVPASVASGATILVAYPALRLAAPDVAPVLLVLVGGALCLGLYALLLRVVFPSSWHAAVRFVVALVRPGRSPGTGASSPTPG